MWIAVSVPETWPAALRLLARTGCVAVFPLGLLAFGVMPVADFRALLGLCRQARRQGVRGMVGAFLTG